MPRSLPRSSVSFALLAAATAWLCIAMPVFSQEAYYWTYAQHPDLSYFDHPPMVAWLIWLGTHVFGNGAAGIRLGTWACGMATAWFGWQLLRDFGIDEKGRNGWVLLGLVSPILAMTHFLANPDAPLVCFWTLTMLALWRARSGSLVWWMIAGAAAGAALLSKYSAAFLAVGGVALFVMDPTMRRQLRRPAPYVAVLVAAIVFLPVVQWNLANHFESFRFQTADRFAKGEAGTRWLLEMAAGQIGVFQPILAVFLPAALWWHGKRRPQRDPRSIWLLAFGAPLPLYLAFNAIWIEVKINWLAPAIVPLLLAMIVWWRESGATALQSRAARWLAPGLLLLPIVVPFAPLMRMIPSGRGSSWTGWDEIAKTAEVWEDRIDAEDGIEGNVFFFGADYRDAAQLGRALRMQWDEEGEHQAIPGQPDSGEPTMAQNVLSMPGLQFDHWEPPRARIGQDAIFVVSRPAQRAAMVEKASKHFRTIEKVESVAIREFGVHVLDADVYVCRDYRGPDGRP